MRWRRVLLIIGACEMAFALALTREMLAFSADPLSGIARLMPAVDLAQVLNWIP